ncbi:MAG TPA: 30S ribosomal protein S20 [Balneolaceae bacterium]|nr:30S ribosomal protein S20 [Balneolaceae bacterium]
MPQHKQAVKRVRQNEKNRKRNNAKRSKLSTLIKKAMQATDKDEAQEHYRNAVSYIDKMTAKGIIHRNYAAKKKSKLTIHLNSL